MKLWASHGFKAHPLRFPMALAITAITPLNSVLGWTQSLLYGSKIANTKINFGSNDTASTTLSGIDQLGAAMLIAALVATPFGIGGAAPAFVHPSWLLWGIAVGLCSSVILYVADQLAMARVRRSTFALMLAILPATATVIGLLVLG